MSLPNIQYIVQYIGRNIATNIAEQNKNICNISFFFTNNNMET